MLERIDNLRTDGSLVSVYRSDDQMLRNNSEPISCQKLLEAFPPGEQCTFRFLTRLDLKEKRKLTHNPCRWASGVAIFPPPLTNLQLHEMQIRI